jgi:biotin carboxyl carrier protein
MEKKRKIMIGTGAAAVLFLAAWLIFFRESPATVETAIASRGPMLVTIDGEGKTRFRDKHVVTAPVSGKMSPVAVRAGDLIPRDYVITEIDPNPPTPRPPSEQRPGPHPWASKVYAPMSGRVLHIAEKDERMIAAGTPIIEIGDPNSVEIVIDILSTDASRIRPGADVLIDNGADGDPVRATVRVVEPQAFTKISALGVEEQRVNVIADLPAAAVRVGDNYRINARIIIWQGEQVLKIPSSAIFRQGDRWSVFVVEAGAARLRQVTVGRRSTAETEIAEGVAEGEKVILHPANNLADGASVTGE